MSAGLVVFCRCISLRLCKPVNVMTVTLDRFAAVRVAFIRKENMRRFSPPTKGFDCLTVAILKTGSDATGIDLQTRTSSHTENLRQEEMKESRGIVMADLLMMGGRAQGREAQQASKASCDLRIRMGEEVEEKQQEQEGARGHELQGAIVSSLEGPEVPLCLVNLFVTVVTVG